MLACDVLGSDDRATHGGFDTHVDLPIDVWITRILACEAILGAPLYGSREDLVDG